ncbi:SDR family NAD(P)-dependent oxidoreductase [Erythrobacter sp.]|uniref:SDR family NAD(P)-dependent oxidoreductase n=1 Tax=Erythrobacter sp. TaxID=1042 RepID=UPI001425E71C|nr:SDR family oxidoreductase [Erythrobacter sp.]QIQ87923.1 MAG: SDR family oxidoreductase [Erythrobacter sp.]
MDLEMEGAKAIVTGATRGIGNRIAEKLLEAGADLAFCARDAEAVAECEKAWGARGFHVKGAAVDVGDADAYRAWLAEAAHWLGGCDAFVHNVSGGGGAGGDAKWRANFEVDLMGAVRGLEALEDHLAKDGGSVLFVSSTAGLETYPFVQPYNVMKAGLIVYAKQISQVLGKKGVRVNCISPGATTFPGGNWEKHKVNYPDYYEATVAEIPFGRLGTAEEVADAGVFLLSKRASWITGVNLIVDGGQTRRVSL